MYSSIVFAIIALQITTGYCEDIPDAIFPTGIDNMGLREGMGDHTRHFHPEIVENVKPGVCPMGWFPQMPHTWEYQFVPCQSNCNMDDDCQWGSKCCYNGCAHICMHAVEWA